MSVLYRLVALALMAAALGAACSGAVSTPVREAAYARAVPAARGLHVVGNRLVDARGQTLHIHGVNRSGTEYSCVHGVGIFDGPSDARSVKAIASWHVNAVRIPLNEDCWLAINGVKPRYAGGNYRRAILAYVRLLHRYGMYAELSLIWGAPGSYHATYQEGGPDADHAPKVWSSLASAFKNDPNVILAPWGETVVNADCFLEGGVCEATFGPKNEPYRIAGMQQAVDVMRSAGYRGVISIPGINYANDLTEWLSHEPRDPLGQLIAEAHVYGKNACADAACFNRTLAPVAKRVPVVLGETGETYDASSCGADHISRIVGWADAHDVGHFAWTWDTWNNCSALIANYSGKAFSRYGAWVKSHYLATRTKARLLPR